MSDPIREFASSFSPPLLLLAAVHVVIKCEEWTLPRVQSLFAALSLSLSLSLSIAPLGHSLVDCRAAAAALSAHDLVTRERKISR